MRHLWTLLFLLATGAASGRAWFVAPDGNDAHDGTISAPLADVQGALDRLRPGDTLYLRGGLYPIDSSLRVRRSGTAARPIVITGYPHETVVIDASAYQLRPDGEHLRPDYESSLLIQDVHYVEVSRLKVVESHSVAVMVRGPGTSHVTLRHLRTDRSFSSGIALWYCDSVLVTHCDIARANLMEMATEGRERRHQAPHEALTIAGATHFEASYNHVHDCDKEGIDVKEVSRRGTVHHNHIHDLKRQGLYADSWFGRLVDVSFFGNRVHDCEWGVAISAEGKGSTLDSVRIHHNLFYDNRGSGVYFSTWGHDLLRTNVWIYHNTIVNNGSPNHWAGTTGGIDLRSRQLRDVRIFNNIVAYNWGYEIGTVVPADEQSQHLDDERILIHDNWLARPHLRADAPGEYDPMHAVQGIRHREGAPGFRDYEARDFKLLPTSGAVQTGAPDALGQRPDLGALPFVAPAGAGR
ncbi:MAG: right-handed parallel beta-helix repeat-containing protein [Catalinimonas sp.]